MENYADEEQAKYAADSIGEKAFWKYIIGSSCIICSIGAALYLEIFWH